MNKDTGTSIRLPEPHNQTFSRSEESLVSSHRHEPVTDEEHFSPRQQTNMSNSGNADFSRGETNSSAPQTNYKTKKSCNVSDEFFYFNNPTEKTPTSYLNEYNDEDLDNLIGGTTLFPEIFDVHNSSFPQ